MDKYNEAIRHIKTIQESLQVSLAMRGARLKDYSYPDELQAIDLAIDTLLQAKERENPQPLKLDELKERVGKPVWVKSKYKGNAWLLLDSTDRLYIYFFNYKGAKIILRISDFNTNNDDWWLAYDHEPKGE